MNIQLRNPNLKLQVKTVLLALTVLVGTNGVAYADTIYKTGFENPPFVSGLLGVQDGWFTGVVNGTVLSPDAASISAALPRQGKQSLLVRGSALVHHDFINSVTGGYYDAIGSYRHTVDFNTLGRKSVRISAHVRVNGKKTADGNNFFSASIGVIGADKLSTDPTTGTTQALGELAISSDGHVYGYEGSTFVPEFLGNLPVSLGQWHKLAIDVNFKKRTYAFSVDDECMGTFPMYSGFLGNFLRRGSMVTYAAPDTATELKANYSAAYDQYIIAEVDEPEDCIK